MAPIIEQILDMAVNKLLNVRRINDNSMLEARAVLCQAYEIFRMSPQSWVKKCDPMISSPQACDLQALCLMFRLNLIQANFFVSRKLIESGREPYADERLGLLTEALEFGECLSKLLRQHFILTMQIDAT